MKYAVTDYDGCEYITAGKRYEILEEGDDYFEIMGDHGIEIGICLENSSHLHGNDWRIEMNNDIEKQGNDFEVKYDRGAKFKPKEDVNDYLHVSGGDLDAIKALDFLEGYFIDSTGGKKDCVNNWIQTVRAALQKQPEMSKSDVTRSDIELIDYFAGQALQGDLASQCDNYIPEPKKSAEKAYCFAKAMMEARK